MLNSTTAVTLVGLIVAGRLEDARNALDRLLQGRESTPGRVPRRRGRPTYLRLVKTETAP